MLKVLFVFSPKELKTKRLEICKQCEHKKVNLIDYCGKCGCSIDAKATFRHQVCPDNRW